MSEEKLITYTAIVIWFSSPSNKSMKGYGFLSWSQDGINPSPDLFVHYSDIDMLGYKFLKPGDRVSFSLGKNHKGDNKAINVKIIS